MHKGMLPIYSLPSTIVLVDDSEELLENLKIHLLDRFHLRCFTEPNKALSYINQLTPHDLIQQCTKTNDLQSYDEFNLQININKIHQIMYLPERFLEVSTIISDYAMPKLNGIDLCEQIKSDDIRKVLLTGQADTNLAIKAFNQGVIDQFIQKSDANLIKLLRDTLNQQIYQYFVKQSQQLFNETSLRQHESLNILLNEKFHAFFNKNCDSNQIIEYYLLDEHGSYILLDKNANSYLLIIRSEDEIAEQVRIAQFEQAKPDLIKHLEQRKSVLFFPNAQAQQSPATQWDTYQFPAKQIPGLKSHYFVLVEDPFFHHESNILAFNQFSDGEL